MIYFVATIETMMARNGLNGSGLQWETVRQTLPVVYNVFMCLAVDIWPDASYGHAPGSTPQGLLAIQREASSP